MTDLRGASVVVVGGGVTGLSSAWWLARTGVDVLVLEAGIVGWEASGRNGGGATHVYSPIGQEEQRLWPQMDTLLEYPTEHMPHRVKVALSEDQLTLYRTNAEIAARQGFRTEPLDRQQIRELVPIVGDNAIGGLYLHFGGHANPQRTVQAYAWALQDLGGRIRQHTPVTGFRLDGGRVTAVETAAGPIGADTVVLAAGPQTDRLAARLGVSVPLAPARVEMICTEPLPLMKVGGVDGKALRPPDAARQPRLRRGPARVARRRRPRGDGRRAADDAAPPEPRPAARRALPRRGAHAHHPELGRDRREHARRAADHRSAARSVERRPRHDVERRVRALAGVRQGDQRARAPQAVPVLRPHRTPAQSLRRDAAGLAHPPGLAAHDRDRLIP
jgi:glycine/D-amino acid oxidase-like deaminating enzyme